MTPRSPALAESGNLIVASTDFASVHAFTGGLMPNVGSAGDFNDLETTLIDHDGQLVAGHIHTYDDTIDTYAPNLSVSMRAPWR